jgi:hypothetical protein
MPELPRGLDLALTNAGFNYNFSTSALTLTATSQHYGRIVFVTEIVGGKRTFLVDLDVPLNVKLSDIPVAGPQVPAALNLGLQELEIAYAADALPSDVVTAIDATLGRLNAKPLRPAEFQAGMLFFAQLQLGDSAQPLSLPRGPSAPPPLQPPPAGTPGPGESSVIKYFDVQKQLGPFQFNRIGVGYSQGELRFALDAGFALGPLVMAMEGLSVSSPLTAFTPHFSIDGLSIDLTRGPLQLSGGFMRVTENQHDAYYGEIAVKIATFGLTALGGFAPADPAHNRPASFFIFASIKVPLGGPPFLFVTGFAGGFGINRELVLPTFESLPHYPLLPARAPAQGATPKDTITNALPVIQQTFPEMPGQYWIAAGISFTSFEMIEAFAAVTVAFGVDFQVGLLGSCAMTFPKGDPAPVAYIEIDIAAAFTPSSGLFSVIGVLTPASFIFGGLVHISGGFAFYIWFDGPNKGQFVVSIGGYHPAFNPPAIYPKVPRLTMQFGVGPLQVIGQAYFALTPAMMMAGLTLQATWSSGGIKAWLDAGVDFLIAWAPFHYEAEAYISIGCSIDLGLFTLELHVGADLTIWGPPFGGQVHVDLDVVSFTIAFGAAAAPPPPIGWSSFREGFLPAPSGQQDKLLASQPRRVARAFQAAPSALAAAPPPPTAGKDNILSATVDAGFKGATAPGFDWVIDPDDFAITAGSTLPANHAAWGPDPSTAVAIPPAPSAYTGAIDTSGKLPCLMLIKNTKPFSDVSVWNPTLGLRPMKQQNISSTLGVAIQRRTNTDAAGQFSMLVVDIAAEPVLLDVNAALYGNTPPSDDANEKALVPNALVGWRLVPVPRHPKTVSNVRLNDLLYQPGYYTNFHFSAATPDSRYAVQLAAPTADTLDVTVTGPDAPSGALHNSGYVMSVLADAFVARQRTGVLTALNTAGFATRSATQIDITHISKDTALTDWPAIGILGGPQAARPRVPVQGGIA